MSIEVAGKLKEAQSFLTSVIAASPDNVGALLLQARLSAQAGDAKGAQAGFDAVLKHDPKNVSAYLGQLGLLEGRGDRVEEASDRVAVDPQLTALAVVGLDDGAHRPATLGGAQAT